MDILRVLACTICGDETLGDPAWLLVTQDYWHDKVTILRWNDRLAARPGVHCACSTTHMQQLVVHWMTTGSLDYPFARSTAPNRQNARGRLPQVETGDFEVLGARQIGELSVHRESMQRALNESPQSLKTILDALSAALQNERACAAVEAAAGQPSPRAFVHEA
jgi:hypothetical protein